MPLHNKSEQHQLQRNLTLPHATSLVVGIVIGTGVFLKAAVMAQEVGSPVLVLGAWIAAGLFSLAGALSLAELGAMMPNAGGQYVYLREAYGDLPAFFFSWNAFAVGAASLAAYGAAFATFLSAVIPLNSVWLERTIHLFGHDVLWQFGLRQIVGLLPLLVFAAVNCASVRVGGHVQTGFTLAKLLGIAILAAGLFFFARGASWNNLALSITVQGHGGLAGFGAAMFSALWAFSGWQYLPMAAGEVRNPSRNIPLAIGTGMIAVIVVYCLINTAYFYSLGAAQVATANSILYPQAPSVGVRAAEMFLGPSAMAFFAIVFVLSTLGSLNGVVLSSARIFFAAARDRLFFSRFAVLRAGAQVPAWSVVLYSLWGCVFVLAGSFDQLTNVAVFANLFFWALSIAAVFVLRRSQPKVSRPYRTPGYPIVPAAFIAVSLWLTYNTLRTNPVEAVACLMILIVGLPLYFVFRSKTIASTPQQVVGRQV
jgi:APA family basic amino acid/polyamine antiporter